jgi:calmodulin
MDITEQQFIAFMSKKNENNYGEDDLLKAFQVFDKDNSGTISTAELRFVLCCLGKKNRKEVLWF